ncbi:HAD family hydrolase [Haloarcula nitratireducens]|uniref:HAD-IA family hydrolase n=1 Tax=Haloarcula nitratireducens TaxID=2487749 RepID=A0AAW4P933_9EURY|nr:HAD-IA family hydrolase [Halomicroarcula nitratireducens]MBX0294175.1 HAD-IA family hydrolase [Halomicroarcula nitratireducens]
MSYDAVVYDLDGTLVQLAVDWDAVAEDVATLLRERGVDPDAGDLWELLERSDETGHRAAVEATITDHERVGARESERLALADGLPHAVPVGVCSLNAEEACRLALETHDLTSAVGSVVGRDTVGSSKPDPEGLLSVVERLDADAESTVFVGDSERDAETARRAGTAFAWASEFDQRRYRA